MKKHYPGKGFRGMMHRDGGLVVHPDAGEIFKTRRMQDPINDMESPEEKEKKIIVKMMDLNYQKLDIAEKINVSRATLYRKIKKYGLAVGK